MLKIFIKDLQLQGLEPLAFLDELQQLYEQLRTAAEEANDLRAFAEAELSLATLHHARAALHQPQCYLEAANYLKAEPSDSIAALWEKRLTYVTNYGVG